MKMTPLEELSVAVPRSDALCKRYARKMDPWWGFVLAGAIWAVCALTIVTLAMMKIGGALGYEDGSHGAKMLSAFMMPIGAILAILAFRWWRHRRLAAKEKLVRDGALVEMEVTGRPFQLGGSKTRTAVDLVGDDRAMRCVFNRWFLPSTGETLSVLHHRDVPHVVAFGRSGAMYSGHVTSGAVVERE
jgi:hypothetical protein